MAVSDVLRTRKAPAENLRTTNAAFVGTIFSPTMARDRFFQNQHVRRFNENTVRNQQRSTGKLVPIRDVFESINSRFEKAYTQNEHINIYEELVMLRLL